MGFGAARAWRLATIDWRAGVRGPAYGVAMPPRPTSPFIALVLCLVLLFGVVLQLVGPSPLDLIDALAREPRLARLGPFRTLGALACGLLVIAPLIGAAVAIGRQRIGRGNAIVIAVCGLLVLGVLGVELFFAGRVLFALSAAVLVDLVGAETVGLALQVVAALGLVVVGVVRAIAPNRWVAAG